MSRRFLRGLLLFIFVLGIAATVLLWDSGDTTSKAACDTCATSVDCQNTFPGTPCAANCSCQTIAGCGVANCFPNP